MVGNTANESVLAGKSAFVSGGSSGIGREIAVQLGAAGAKVTVCARRVERLDETADVIRQAGGKAQVVAETMKRPLKWVLNKPSTPSNGLTMHEHESFL